MDSLKGAKLVKADGSSVEADAALAGKVNIKNMENFIYFVVQEVILYYFSAHWCPPCRQFTPMLKDFYGEIEDQNVEIVFVSSDRSTEDMLSYMKESHGDWLATEHGSELTKSLKEKYGISGIPTLIVVKADGTVVTKDGRADVVSKQPKQAVQAWKA